MCGLSDFFTDEPFSFLFIYILTLHIKVFSMPIYQADFEWNWSYWNKNFFLGTVQEFAIYLSEIILPKAAV